MILLSLNMLYAMTNIQEKLRQKSRNEKRQSCNHRVLITQPIQSGYRANAEWIDLGSLTLTLLILSVYIEVIFLFGSEDHRWLEIIRN